MRAITAKTQSTSAELAALVETPREHRSVGGERQRVIAARADGDDRAEQPDVVRPVHVDRHGAVHRRVHGPDAELAIEAVDVRPWRTVEGAGVGDDRAHRQDYRAMGLLDRFAKIRTSRSRG